MASPISCPAANSATDVSLAGRKNGGAVRHLYYGSSQCASVIACDSACENITAIQALLQGSMHY